MRAILVVLACSGCASILGDYEVDPTLDKKDAVVDTAADTARDTPSDTAVVDTKPPSNIKPCKVLGGEGPKPLGDGVTSFCSQGYTLVALRSSTTPGTAWEGIPGALRTKDLGNPHLNADRLLDIEWPLLDFTEVMYELGTPPSTMGGPPSLGARVYFRGLTGPQKEKAQSALGMFVPNPERLDCFLDTAATSITKCEEPTMPMTLEPPSSFGWVFLSKKALCYWGYKGKPGAPNCNDGVVGGGRVWVK